MGRARIITALIAVLACGFCLMRLGKREKWPPDPVSLSIGSAIISEEDFARAKLHLTHARFEIDPASRVLHPYQKIFCRVRIIAPDGDEPPHCLFAVLRVRGMFHCRVPLEPKEHKGTEYALETVLRAPSRPGTYQLGLEAEYSVRGKEIAATDAAGPARDWRSVQHRIDGPDIKVHR